jgi:hypothetical protein
MPDARQMDRLRRKARRAALVKWCVPAAPAPCASLLTIQPNRDRARRPLAYC